MRTLGWVTLAIVLTWAAPAGALIGNDGSTVKDVSKKHSPAAMENEIQPGPAARTGIAAPAAAKRKVAKPMKPVKPAGKGKQPKRPTPKPSATP